MGFPSRLSGGLFLCWHQRFHGFLRFYLLFSCKPQWALSALSAIGSPPRFVETVSRLSLCFFFFSFCFHSWGGGFPLMTSIALELAFSCLLCLDH